MLAETPKLAHALAAVIQARRSWRRYAKRPIPPQTLDALERALRAPPLPPFGTRVRLALLERRGDVDKPCRLGTYGMIRGAQTFVAGAVQQGKRDLEDFGYIFEWLLLRATGLGLATCWLGATLRRNRFARGMAVADDEHVPAASPVGFATTRRGVVDSVFRWAIGSKRRRPWSALFFDGGFDTPLNPSDADGHALALEMVRLGPSAMNNQPWRVVRDAAGYHFYLRRARSYRRYFEVDLQRLDMGVALCHFELTTRSLGLGGQWADAEPQIDDPPPRTSYLCSWVEGRS